MWRRWRRNDAPGAGISEVSGTRPPVTIVCWGPGVRGGGITESGVLRNCSPAWARSSHPGPYPSVFPLSFDLLTPIVVCHSASTTLAVRSTRIVGIGICAVALGSLHACMCSKTLRFQPFVIPHPLGVLPTCATSNRAKSYKSLGDRVVPMSPVNLRRATDLPTLICCSQIVCTNLLTLGAGLCN